MINCAIVDDEHHSIEVLEYHVSQCNLLNLVAAVSSPVEALNLVARGNIDLLFLDVHMPEISGLDVAKSVAGQCRIIFTTAYPEYALDGFDLGVGDYLLKPISYPRFLKAVQRVVDSIKSDRSTPTPVGDKTHIFIKTGVKNNVLKIHLDDIEYIESLKNYVAIYHAGKKTVAYLSMKDLEATLPQHRFMRIHKSYIVSLAHISRVEGTEILLTNLHTRVAIGESYKERFWSLIKKTTLG